ncbi:hypothetical protein CAOG_02826 [Capsaspora owczarzaki ATCC 30864]|uniref:Transmembrane protein n=1 Tax=Capsaspora owczarzaki (strain ATCC 30864) TaxID=595528 RepID=A0A0D2U9H9_CAPO3|nr:hypothetical protein CAOG_02826 [Capsaspora owczarzaki ATCC 30864]KJE91731.1 hypothetical protein CAOG_002826 [Capsaspora owczarzaki ATCC 30864]|eukprot:XP_004348639.1 hypothetical protein CAOG_02826 [Capsaspora owczarzaki ATCC 30864]
MVSPGAVRFVQVLSVLSCIGVIVCGILQLKNGGLGSGSSLNLQYCETSPTEACWEDNYGPNAGYAMTLYGGVLVAFGCILFMVGARSEGWFPALQPWRYCGVALLGTGICTLGSAANLGIILGGFAILVGLTMFLMAVISNVEYGMEPGKEPWIPLGIITFVQLMAALWAIGAIAVGLMCIISQARNDTKLEWCKTQSGQDDEVCWTQTYNTKFAYCCYGAGLMIFGAIAFIATIRFKNWFPSLYQWNVLSLVHVFVGVISLGATGNTGIILGSLEIGFGGIMMLMFIFFSVTSGPKSL